MEAFVAISRGGEMNWLRLAEQIAAGADAGGEGKTPAAKPPEWSVDEIRLVNGTMRWQDESTLRPTQGQVLDLNVAVGKIDSTLANPIEISEASYRLDLGERLRVGSKHGEGRPRGPARTSHRCGRGQPSRTQGAAGAQQGRGDRVAEFASAEDPCARSRKSCRMIVPGMPASRSWRSMTWRFASKTARPRRLPCR
jgi:hypothetical protein